MTTLADKLFKQLESIDPPTDVDPTEIIHTYLEDMGLMVLHVRPSPETGPEDFKASVDRTAFTSTDMDGITDALKFDAYKVEREGETMHITFVKN